MKHLIIDATFKKGDFYLPACLEAIRRFANCDLISVVGNNPSPELIYHPDGVKWDISIEYFCSINDFLDRFLKEKNTAESENYFKKVILLSARLIFVRKFNFFFERHFYKHEGNLIISSINQDTVLQLKSKFSTKIESNIRSNDYGQLLNIVTDGISDALEISANDSSDNPDTLARLLKISDAKKSTGNQTNDALLYTAHWDPYLQGDRKSYLSSNDQESLLIIRSLYRDYCRYYIRNALFYGLDKNNITERFYVNHHYSRGIFHSEMLAVINIISNQKIDIVIESGRANGQSTESLARHLNCPIYSIELVRDQTAIASESRLSGFSNVKLLYGDSRDVALKIVKNNKNKRIAVLLDGPKGLLALALANDLMQFENVIAVFVHDMRILENGHLSISRFLAYRIFDVLYFTDDQEWVNRFCFLDDSCFERTESKTWDSWTPQYKSWEYVSSYGPTMLIALINEQDRLRAKRLSRRLIFMAIKMFYVLNDVITKITRRFINFGFTRFFKSL